MINKIFNEPCLETLKRMQDKSIDCVITSPPYWQLRDYGYNGQWGLEPTFHEYLEHLWQLMDEIYRVLKDEGTCWVNLGDSYSRTGGKSIGRLQPNSIIGNTKKGIRGGNCKGVVGIKNKCLLLIPHRFAIGCIDRGWILRNDIIWAKRNGMPESINDRFTKKHEYIFFFVKQEKYYFDLDIIRDKTKVPPNGRSFGNNQSSGKKERGEWKPKEFKDKNPGDVSDFWNIPTKASPEEHYASYNTDLIKKPILAGCPEGGVIYDPFMGTGTTAVAALRANRNFIGSEMSEEYIKICNSNIEPYLKQTKLF